MTTVAATLTLDVYTAPIRPVNRSDPPPPGGWTWPPNTSVLVSGDREAVLVDALSTIEEATALADWVEAKGKQLTTLYLTHDHPDHFLGAPIMLERFPGLRFVATPMVIEDVHRHLSSGEIESYWKPMFKGRVADGQVAPEPLADLVIDLEGHELRAVQTGQSDTAHSTFLYVPALAAIIAGDIAYNDVHCNIASTDHRKRLEWIETLRKLGELRPEIVVADHRRPDAADTAAVVPETSAYITDFDAVLAEGGGVAEVIEKMLALYPTRLNITTVYHCAYALAG